MSTTLPFDSHNGKRTHHRYLEHTLFLSWMHPKCHPNDHQHHNTSPMHTPKSLHHHFHIVYNPMHHAKWCHEYSTHPCCAMQWPHMAQTTQPLIWQGISYWKTHPPIPRASPSNQVGQHAHCKGSHQRDRTVQTYTKIRTPK